MLVDGRKVAGILVEGRPQEGWAVLGIGLNVAVAPTTSAGAARHRRHAGPRPGRPRAHAATPAGALERWLAGRPGDVLAAWRERDALAGRAVRWTEGSGNGGGIDDAGRLLVGTRRARVALDAGEVHLRRPPPGIDGS